MKTNQLGQYDLKKVRNANENRHTFFHQKAVTANAVKVPFFKGISNADETICHLDGDQTLPNGQSFMGFAIGLKLLPASNVTATELRALISWLNKSMIEYSQNNQLLAQLSISELFPNVDALIDTGAGNTFVANTQLNAPSEIALGEFPQLWPENAKFSYELKSSVACPHDCTLKLEVKGLWKSVNASQAVG